MRLCPLFKKHLTAIAAASVAIVVACSWNTMCSAEDATETDWPRWRGPNHNGISSEKRWLSTWPDEGPEQLWKASVGVGFSSVAVGDGRLYTMGNTEGADTIYCFDAETGAEVWKYSYPCTAGGDSFEGPASTPTVDGKSVYTLSHEGDLYCFDSGSGEVIWSKDLLKDFEAKRPAYQYASSPLILGNMLVLEVGITLALDKSTGELIWKTKDYGGGYSSPAAFHLDGSQCLAIFNESGLVILDADKGEELGQLQWKCKYNVNAVTPIISVDKVFISTGYNRGCALVQISGNEPVIIWENKNMRNQTNNSVLWEGHLYGFDEEQLRCLDFQTGNVKWSQRGLGKGSLMIADGKMVLMSDKGELAIAEASPDSYMELARTKVLGGLCWTVPVLSGGRIYCRNHEGDLVCVDVRAGN